MGTSFFFVLAGQGGISAASGAAATEEAAAATAASETHPAASGAGPSSMLVLSGGEGYVDFRQGKTPKTSATQRTSNSSFLIKTRVLIGKRREKKEPPCPLCVPRIFASL